MTVKTAAKSTVKSSNAVGVASAGPAAGTTVLPGSNSGSAVASAPTGFQESLLQLQQGVEAVIPDGSTLASATGGFAKAAILTQLAQWIAMYAAIEKDKQQMQADQLSLRTALPAAHAYYTSLKAAIVGFFEPGNPVLTEFGIKPKKPAAKLPAAKLAEAAIRRAATRQIRGTMGPKARQQAAKFTGTISPAAVAAPVASATAPAPTAQVAAAVPSPAQGTASAAPAQAVTPAPVTSAGSAPTAG